MDETQRMLSLLNESFPDLAALEPAEARLAVDSRIRPAANVDDVAGTEDHAVDAGGHRISVRVYRPHSRDEAAPLTVFIHGGGYLHGSIEGHDGFCRRWAKGTASVVISVDYRVSTQTAPPGARDDVLAAIDWAVDAGLAPTGILLAGDSSGGALAAAAAIALRDRGASPVVGQVLLYPFLDPSMSSESHRSRATGFFVTSRLLDYYWRVYLADAAAVPAHDITPYAVDDLTGLPPAIVVTAGLDPLQDEGEAFAQRLRDAGAPVVLRRYAGQFHGFLTIPGYAPGESAAPVLWSDVRSLTTQLEEER